MLTPNEFLGDLPEVEDGVVEREACTDERCFPKYDIQVVKCAGVGYVYYLVPVLACPDAYCMGERASGLVGVRMSG